MAITLGNADSGGAGASSIDLSLTVQSADDKLVVGCGCEDPEVITSVVIDPGGADEASFTEEVVQTSSNGQAYLFYLDETDIPPAGTYTVRVTADGFSGIGAFVRALQGAEQGSFEASNSRENAAGGHSIDITTLTDGAVVFDFVSNRAPEAGLASGVDQTTEFVDADLSNNSAGGSRRSVATAGQISMVWTADTSMPGVQVAGSVAPAGATGSPGLEGSVWIEGTDLHWIDANDTEQNVTGTDTGNDPAGAVAGSCWIEGSDWHYIDATGNERTITGTDTGNDPAGAVSGSAWIEGANLHYIDASGNERTIS